MDVLRHWALKTERGWVVAADVNPDEHGPTILAKEDAERLAARLNDHAGAVERAEKAERQLAIARQQRDDCHREREAAEAEVERLSGGQ